MKEKKQSHSSIVAIVHLVIGGFIIPLIGYGLLYFALSALFPGIFEQNGDGLLFTVIAWVVSIGLLIAGVIYSSDYIAEKYVIKDTHLVVIRSTYYFALLALVGIILGMVLDNSLTFVERIINWGTSVINVLVFYYVSKRFLPKAIAKHS